MINDLGYDVLVPGHGDIQYSTDYVDLMIEALDSVAEQTDRFIEAGLTQEEAGDRLDFFGIRRAIHGWRCLHNALLQGLLYRATSIFGIPSCERRSDGQARAG